MKLFEFIKWVWRDKSTPAVRARTLIKLSILAVLFVILFWLVDFKEIIRALASANLKYLSISFLLVVPVLYLTALQLKILTRKQGIAIGTSQILEINLAIAFYLLFMPGTLVGSGMRWYRLSQPQGKRAEALAAVAFNRIVEVFFVVVLGLGFWLLSGQQKSNTNVWFFVSLIAGCIFFWIITTRISTPLSDFIDTNITHVNKFAYMEWGLRKLQKLLLAITAYSDFPIRDIILLISVGLLKNLTGILSFWTLALSVGINLQYVDIGWIRSVVQLVNYLPFSVGGLGYREVSLVFMLGMFGISAEVALAYSFLLFVRTLIIGLVGGLVEAGRSIWGKKSIQKEPVMTGSEFSQITSFEESKD